MQIHIPDDLAAEALKTLAKPTHKSLTPYVQDFLREALAKRKPVTIENRAAEGSAP